MYKMYGKHIIAVQSQQRKSMYEEHTKAWDF